MVIPYERLPNPLMSYDQIKDIRQTIRISIIEGMFSQAHQAMVAPGSIFLTKFAVMLNAQPLHFGILAAIGQLSLVAQPYGSVLTRRVTSRKKVLLPLLNISRTLPFFFGLFPFILAPTSALWSFLVLFFICSVINSLAGNLWIAWISDMIPLRFRGRFFSLRSRYLMVAGLLTGYLMGFVIDLFDSNPDSIVTHFKASISRMPVFSFENLPYVFLLIFLAAVILGFVSTRILSLQPENPKQLEEQTLVEMLRDSMSDRNFRRLIFYGVWWMFAVGIAAPFWGPFMLQKLKMSMIEIQIYGTISTLSGLASLRAWGRLIDRFGNKTAMRLSLMLGGMNPILWLFANQNRTWIVYAESLTSGIMWAGAGIVGTNFVLAIAPKDKAQIYSGIYGALTGAAMMITMLLSGAFLPDPVNLYGLRLEPEQVLFGLAGLARWSAQIPLSLIHEPHGRELGWPMYYLRSATQMMRNQGKQWFLRR